jgi:hypothetical protein
MFGVVKFTHDFDLLVDVLFQKGFFLSWILVMILIAKYFAFFSKLQSLCTVLAKNHFYIRSLTFRFNDFVIMLLPNLSHVFKLLLHFIAI